MHVLVIEINIFIVNNFIYLASATFEYFFSRMVSVKLIKEISSLTTSVLFSLSV